MATTDQCQSKKDEAAQTGEKQLKVSMKKDGVNRSRQSGEEKGLG